MKAPQIAASTHGRKHFYNMKTNNNPVANAATTKNTTIVNNLQSAKAPTATAKAAKAAQPREMSLFVKNWRTIAANKGGANWAYRTVYENASPEYQAAMIQPAALFKGDQFRAEYADYCAHCSAKAGKKGVSPFAAYLWANKEMKNYLRTAPADDTRARKVAKVVRAEKVARQNKATAKK